MLKDQLAETSIRETVVVNIGGGGFEKVRQMNEKEATPFLDAKAIQEVQLNPARVSKLKNELLQAPRLIKASSTAISCSIHRVPNRFRQDHESAYLPQIISIGPFHHHRRNSHLQAMEEHKRQYLRSVLARKGNSSSLEDYLKAVKSLDRQARECYSEEFELDSDLFAEMMLLDGCFIIELFRRTWVGDYEDDPLIKLEWLRRHLAIDLLMLENQIPFLILRHLFNLIDIRCVSLAAMALKFFSFVLPAEKFTIHPNVQIHHLLHLLHSSFLPLPHEKNICHTPKPGIIKMIPCASELEAVGMTFEKKIGGKEGFMNIRFRPRRGLVTRGVIEIPHMTVSDVTRILFLNLVAFEQCYRHCSTDFSGYIVILDCLIGSVEDAGILCNHGIDNCLGSNQLLVDLVNKIGGRLIIDDCNLEQTFAQINQHYEEIIKNRLRQSFNRNYIKNSFLVMSVCLAVLSVVSATNFQLINLIRSFK